MPITVSYDTNEIYLYDSLYHGTVSNETVLQLSSLLHQNDDCDELSIHVRNFDIQPNRTHLCGVYTVVAALSICNGIDPSGNCYDTDTITQKVNNMIMQEQTDIIPPRKNVRAGDTTVVVKSKLHCLCHSTWDGVQEMIACSQCRYRGIICGGQGGQLPPPRPQAKKIICSAK